jgi:hypothetical protein
MVIDTIFLTTISVYDTVEMLDLPKGGKMICVIECGAKQKPGAKFSSEFGSRM